MKLQRSDAHFPYRRYGFAPRYRAPLLRRLRRLLQMHDIWAWIFVIAFIAILLTMEAMR